MNIDEFLKTTQEGLNSDLRFAEAKHTALITFNSAMIALTSNDLFKNKSGGNSWSWFSILTAVSIVLLLIPVLLSLLSLQPNHHISISVKSKNNNTDNHNRIWNRSVICRRKDINKRKNVDFPRYAYYRYIHKYYPANNEESHESYLKAITNNNSLFFEELPSIQTARQIVDLADVCNRKFFLFRIAILFELVAIVFWCSLAIFSVLCN